jgi:iron(III) transport system permease protein
MMLKFSRHARLDDAVGKLVVGLGNLAVAIAIVVPIAVVLFVAFRNDTPGSSNSEWTLENIERVYHSTFVLRPLFSTLITCVPATVLAVSVGFLLAWLIERTDIRGRRVLEPLIVASLYFSPLSFAGGWIILASPRVGLLNLAWPFGGSIVNVYSVTAITLFIAVNFVPYAFLIFSGAFRNLDSGFEDASAILGASTFRTLRSITFAMLRPQFLASALLILIISFSLFAEPALFGVRFDFVNLPIAMYRAMASTPVNFNLAAAIGTVMLIGALVGLAIYRWALSRAERFITTQTRGGGAIRRITLGRSGPIVNLLVAGYVGAVLTLPIMALLYASFVRYLGPRFSWSLFTLDNYGLALKNPLMLTALTNTLILSLGIATITTAFGFIVAYSIVRGRTKAATFLDVIAILPVGVPAIVLSLGFLWAYLWAPVNIYGTIWALMIALSTIIIPTVIRPLDAALRQLGTEVEFAGQVLGAGLTRRLVQIVVPMCKTSLLSAWLLAFLLTTIQVSAPILLRTPGQELLSVAVWILIVDSGDIGQASVAALLQGIVSGLVVYAARRLAVRYGA